MFIVEDDLHSEQIQRFETLGDAVREVRRLAALPWDVEPNRAPCTSWQTCGRDWGVVEYDDRVHPWRQLSRVRVVTIRAGGVSWAGEFAPSG